MEVASQLMHKKHEHDVQYPSRHSHLDMNTWTLKQGGQINLQSE